MGKLNGILLIKIMNVEVSNFSIVFLKTHVGLKNTKVLKNSLENVKYG